MSSRLVSVPFVGERGMAIQPRLLRSLLIVAAILATMATPSRAAAQYCWQCDEIDGCYAQQYESGQADCEVLYGDEEETLPVLCVTDGVTCSNHMWYMANSDWPVPEDYLESIGAAVKQGDSCQRPKTEETPVVTSHREGVAANMAVRTV